MRALTPFILAPALLLAACGDNDQQASGNSEQRRGGQQVATTPNPPASTPETGAGAPRAAGEPATTGSIPGSGANAQAGNLPASAPGAGAAVLSGRAFTTTSGTLQFMADNRFQWRDQAGKTLTGRYVQEAERVSFNEVQGDAGASIPMTCRIRMDGADKFIFEDSGTTCPVFRGLAFQAAG
jgi:hypothetical protein